MTLVRTTLWPDREIDVDAAEYLDLQRMGILVQDAPVTPPTPPAATGSAPATPTPSSTADSSTSTAGKGK